MKNKKGFTLIELLFVVAIVCIMVGILLSAIEAARDKREKEEKAKSSYQHREKRYSSSEPATQTNSKDKITIEWSEGVSVIQEGNKLMLELEHRE